MITISEYLVQELVQQGVDHIFGYIGARNILLVEAAYKTAGVKFVNVYHEQTASFAACAYAQKSGRPGVAISTSGPGATNMLTGIASAFCDSVPCLFLTGQAPIAGLRGQYPIRNRSVQEVDIVSMAKPVTKYAVQIRDKKDIRYEFEKALFLALDGRQGPVLLDLPEDIQRMEVEPAELKGFVPEKQVLSISNDNVNSLSQLIKENHRPVIMTGNGMHGFERELAGIADKTGVPIVASMSAVDIYDNDKPNYMGVAGNYGLRCANFTLANADLIICLGCTMTKRYTGNDVRQFAPEAKIVRVDIDQAELDDRTLKPDELKLHIDLRTLFEKYSDMLCLLEPSDAWLALTRSYRERYFNENKKASPIQIEENLSPYDIIYAMNDSRRAGDVVCADVGNHQIWGIQALQFSNGHRFISTSGLSTMGYGLPAAIGAYAAAPGSDVICLCGDGGLQMCIQEMQLLVRENLPITIVLLNNRVLGMIKTLQDTYYNGECYASVTDYTAPDFISVARSYGIESVSVNSVDEFTQAFAKRGGKPLLINVAISADFETTPRITNRRPIWDLYPLLSDAELSENMVVRYKRGSQ